MGLRIGILTRNLPPRYCGIGDYSVNLAGELRSQGHEVLLIGSRGEYAPGLKIVPDDWSVSGLNRLYSHIQAMQLGHLILQFTPLMYIQDGWRNQSLIELWQKLSDVANTSLIVHETYFRSWCRPKSILRGAFEKRDLVAMCRASHNVFTASEPLIFEMAEWRLQRPPILLPIGSNVPEAVSDIEALRTHYRLTPGTLVLTLFGGGNNLMWKLDHVQRLEQRLRQGGIEHVWLLLGGIPRSWLPEGAAVVDPGRLPLPELSAHLQMTDLFLMPNWSGVSAKRGTLMAAMNHALPVVGTRGYMTDRFWGGVEGVLLAQQNDIAGFVDMVVALAGDPLRRQLLGKANRKYFLAHFSREVIVQQLIDALHVRGSEC